MNPKRLQDFFPVGTQVTVGCKHSNRLYYERLAGQNATISRILIEGMFHYTVIDSEGNGWNIHAEDAIPINLTNNAKAKILLSKEDS